LGRSSSNFRGVRRSHTPVGAFASLATRWASPHAAQVSLHKIKLKKTIIKQKENEADSSYLERKIDGSINDMVNVAVKTP
jgi:hypothetical protein